MIHKVSITFLREMNSWEGVFAKGSTHECAEPIAEQLRKEGYVSISQVKAAAPELSVEPPQEFPASRKSRKKTSNK